MADEQEQVQQAVDASADGKVFVGGISWDTDTDGLRKYFSQFGELTDCVMLKDKVTNRSRGFGFVTFKDSAIAEQVVQERHIVDGKVVEAKKAVPREQAPIRGGVRAKKVFIGGLMNGTTDLMLRRYFEQFGRVVDAQVMVDKESGKSRGFGFVSYDGEESLNRVLTTDHTVNGKRVDVKRAVPRGAASLVQGQTLNQNHSNSMNANPFQTHTHTHGPPGLYRFDQDYGLGIGMGAGMGMNMNMGNMTFSPGIGMVDDSTRGGGVAGTTWSSQAAAQSQSQAQGQGQGVGYSPQLGFASLTRGFSGLTLSNPPSPYGSNPASPAPIHLAMPANIPGMGVGVGGIDAVQAQVLNQNYRLFNHGHGHGGRRERERERERERAESQRLFDQSQGVQGQYSHAQPKQLPTAYYTSSTLPTLPLAMPIATQASTSPSTSPPQAHAQQAPGLSTPPRVPKPARTHTHPHPHTHVDVSPGASQTSLDGAVYNYMPHLTDSEEEGEGEGEL